MANAGNGNVTKEVVNETGKALDGLKKKVAAAKNEIDNFVASASSKSTTETFHNDIQLRRKKYDYNDYHFKYPNTVNGLVPLPRQATKGEWEKIMGSMVDSDTITKTDIREMKKSIPSPRVLPAGTFKQFGEFENITKPTEGLSDFYKRQDKEEAYYKSIGSSGNFFNTFERESEALRKNEKEMEIRQRNMRAAVATQDKFRISVAKTQQELFRYGMSISDNGKIVRVNAEGIEKAMVKQEAATNHAKETMEFYSNKSALALSQNMSALSFTFGSMNTMKMATTYLVDSEMADLRAKEKLTEADKKRIKVLQHKRAEYNKLSTTIQFAISFYQIIKTAQTLYYQKKMNEARSNYIAQKSQLDNLKATRLATRFEEKRMAVLMKANGVIKRNTMLKVENGKVEYENVLGDMKKMEAERIKGGQTAVLNKEIVEQNALLKEKLMLGPALERQNAVITAEYTAQRNAISGVNVQRGMNNTLTGTGTALETANAAAVNKGTLAYAKQGATAAATAGAKLAAWMSSNMVTMGMGLMIAATTIATVASLVNAVKPPKMAEGGLVKARNGGTNVIVGEGGQDELIIPLSKVGGGISHGGDIIINALDPYSTYHILNNMKKSESNSRW